MTSEVRQLAQDADVICVIIHNVFLSPWTYPYQSMFYIMNMILCYFKTQSNCWVMADYLCLVLLVHLDGFLSSRALIGYLLGSLF